jgi:scyllo-inositol 2-dehydrogenase (NADP+)
MCFASEPIIDKKAEVKRMAIKTAILGFGRSGSTLHAEPIERLPEFDLSAVFDIDPKAREDAYNRFHCKVYDNYNEMMADKELELVVIVTRSDQHFQMASDCLKAGKNVVVTKPWALNQREAEEMISIANRSGKLLMPWLPARWGCDLLRLRELIDSGVIGRVFQVRRSEFTFGVRYDWQTQKRYGGGYLLNWGPHLVDQPMQLIGKPVKSVYGELKQINNPGDAEDVFFAVMKTEDDVTIVSEFNIGAEKLPNWVVQGEKGTIFVQGTDIEIHKVSYPEPVDRTLYRSQYEVKVEKDKPEGADRLTPDSRYGDSLAVYSHIAKAIAGEEAYMVSLESALNLTRVLDAIRESHERKQVIHLR